MRRIRRRPKVILFERVTLDGFFQGPKSWDIEFFKLAASKEFTRFCVEMERQAGGILLGRKTYQGFAGYWPSAKGPEAPLMNGLPKYVFTKSLTRADWSNSVVVHESPPAVVRRLKRRPGKDLFVWGSGEIAASLRQSGLIDEYWFQVVPVLLGKGRPVFPPSFGALPLTLEVAQPMADGGVILRYRPRHVAKRRRG